MCYSESVNTRPICNYLKNVSTVDAARTFKTFLKPLEVKLKTKHVKNFTIGLVVSR